MILIFDMDDTLYPEFDFVKQGFKHVANFVEETFGLSSESVYESLLDIHHEHGRGQVFDIFLKRQGIFSLRTVKKCLAIYRYSVPNITLPDSTVEVLNRFASRKLYLVTDGNKIVQVKKANALGLQSFFTKCFFTHMYGKRHAKPSIYCFEKIAALEKTNFQELIYVGDDPNKDFVALNERGGLTIRVLTGRYKNLEVGKEYDGKFVINSLSELPSLVEKLEALS